MSLQIPTKSILRNVPFEANTPRPPCRREPYGSGARRAPTSEAPACSARRLTWDLETNLVLGTLFWTFRWGFGGVPVKHPRNHSHLINCVWNNQSKFQSKCEILCCFAKRRLQQSVQQVQKDLPPADLDDGVAPRSCLRCHTPNPPKQLRPILQAAGHAGRAISQTPPGQPLHATTFVHRTSCCFPSQNATNLMLSSPQKRARAWVVQQFLPHPTPCHSIPI